MLIINTTRLQKTKIWKRYTHRSPKNKTPLSASNTTHGQMRPSYPLNTTKISLPFPI